MDFDLFKNGTITQEETVYYWIFPCSSDGSPIVNEEDLRNLCSEYMAFFQIYIEDYIWNNENFTLSVCTELNSDQLSLGVSRPHIGGRMNVGDYLEDEWFVVFLLITLTKQYPNIVCRVLDNDGEFPLIEAAQHLPKWADPETAEHRVFLRKGSLHLVSPTLVPIPPSTTTDEGRPPQIAMAALDHVSHMPSLTLAAPAIQSSVSHKISGYPRKISREHHTTHALVPVGVAALLHEYPTLVSAAVKAFCGRDVSDNKCLRIMRHFPPETRVMTSVRFSKALYARINANPFTPDRRTGWNISHTDNKAEVIGMKLACGFEILVCSVGGMTPLIGTPIDRDPQEVDSLSNNTQWQRYRTSLLDKGYFRGELECSVLFRELEENARRFFVSNKMLSGKEDDLDQLSIGSVVVKLLSKVDVDYEAFKEREKMLAPPDDEKWLELTPTSLDEMLESKFRSENREPKSGRSDSEIGESLNAFFQHVSSYEGAEIPEELRTSINRKRSDVPVNSRKVSTARKKSSTGTALRKGSGVTHPQCRKISSYSNASDCSEMSSFSAKIDFNADAFSDALNSILDFSVPNDEYFNGADDDSSGLSSYENDDEADVSLSRKSSNGSSASKGSSGVGADFEPRRDPLRPPRGIKKRFKGTAKDIPLADFDEDLLGDDEVDTAEVVQELKRNCKEECGVGPSSALLSSLGVNPIMK